MFIAIFLALALISATSSKPARDAAASSICDDGWTRYEDSCYYIERDEKMPFRQAEQRCHDKDASIFVANSIGEYRTIVLSAPLNFWSWIGLYKETESAPAVWESPDAMNHTKLDWISKPYGNAANGWTTASQCAAHWNPSTELGKYTYWYPCNYSFYFICERNQTIAANKKI